MCNVWSALEHKTCKKQVNKQQNTLSQIFCSSLLIIKRFYIAFYTLADNNLTQLPIFHALPTKPPDLYH